MRAFHKLYIEEDKQPEFWTTERRNRLLALRKCAKIIGQHKIDIQGFRTEIRAYRNHLKAPLHNYRVIKSRDGLNINFTIHSLSIINTLSKQDRAYHRKCWANSLKEEIRYRRSQRKEVIPKFRRIGDAEYNLVGLVHQFPGFALKHAKVAKTRALRNPKKPKNLAFHIGIEIEFISPLDRASIQDRLCDANLHTDVNIRDDGSIQTLSQPCECPCECTETETCIMCDEGCQGDCERERLYGHELCILSTESNLDTTLSKVKTFLADVEASVNSSCGLHVHLDMREKDYARAFSNLVSCQSILYAMCPTSRKKSQYCRPIGKREFHMPGDRYHGINPHALSKHKTLEVRIHSGTVNIIKIKRWVSLLVAIVNAPKIPTSLRSLKRLKECTGISSELLNYVKKRIQKFKGKSVEDTDELAA